MLLSLADATTLLERARPKGIVKAGISYKEEYVFVLFLREAPDDVLYDPYVAVNKISGAIREFSIFTDGDPEEVLRLFKDSMK